MESAIPVAVVIARKSRRSSIPRRACGVGTASAGGLLKPIRLRKVLRHGISYALVLDRRECRFQLGGCGSATLQDVKLWQTFGHEIVLPRPATSRGNWPSRERRPSSRPDLWNENNGFL